MFKDLIQTFGLPITSFTVSGDIKQKSSENVFKKKNSKNDQFTGHFQSLFIYLFSSPLPTSPPQPLIWTKIPVNQLKKSLA